MPRARTSDLIFHKTYSASEIEEVNAFYHEVRQPHLLSMLASGDGHGCELAVGFGADQRDRILKSPVTPGSRAGSSAFVVQVGSASAFEGLQWPSRDVQNAAAQEIEVGATIHLPLQQLEPVDLPFDRTVAPRLRQGRPNCADVADEPGDKAAQGG